MGGGVLSKGRKAASAEWRRTWHSDIAAPVAMSRFWVDPGPALSLPISWAYWLLQAALRCAGT